MEDSLNATTPPVLNKRHAVALMCRAEPIPDGETWRDAEGNRWTVMDMDCGFSRGVAVEAGPARQAERFDPADVVEARLVRSRLTRWARGIAA